MTKGELIVACIKLMFDNDDEQLDPEAISEMEEYKDRTANIIESINRGYSRVIALKKMPFYTFTITSESPNNVVNGMARYDIDVIGDMTIQKVTLVDNNLALSDVPYKLTTNRDTSRRELQIRQLTGNERYVIQYLPFRYLQYSDLDTMEIPCPDNINRLLPYFVKGDLYEDSNAQLALLSTNKFESYLNDLPTQQDVVFKRVKDVYNFF